ncbi:hypothetical protein PHMEG_0009692 [Phytophthora megakarya]|uniref:Uncharacterized protein n=1 Tax=Phytophthora megakarya TaxID=4795 RepID=A0A225WGY4_9STRA|nr:hypothetical protein PHMEG_0009692 [Phytophthora megakarya]
MEKRFYFQNGLRVEIAKSPRFLHEVIEIATNFELAHYGGRLQRSIRVQPLQSHLQAITHPSGIRKVDGSEKHFKSGSFYPILEVSAWASKQSEPPSAVSIFVHNGSSLNGTTEE